MVLQHSQSRHRDLRNKTWTCTTTRNVHQNHHCHCCWRLETKKRDTFSNIVTTQPSAAYAEHSEGSTIVSAPETSPKTTETSQKWPKSTELPVSEHFNWADDAKSLPISSKIPIYSRDLSCLRSSSINPFSSLCRRCRQPQKFYSFINSFPQSCCHYTYQKPYSHSSPSRTPCHPSQLHIPILLNWDQDPCLADLSNALWALGWVRQWCLCFLQFITFLEKLFYFRHHLICDICFFFLLVVCFHGY